MQCWVIKSPNFTVCSWCCLQQIRINHTLILWCHQVRHYRTVVMNKGCHQCQLLTFTRKSHLSNDHPVTTRMLPGIALLQVPTECLPVCFLRKEWLHFVCGRVCVCVHAHACVRCWMWPYLCQLSSRQESHLHHHRSQLQWPPFAGILPQW